MTTTINNEHKKLNVPNKREQNQTCLDSAEREGLRPKGNVPNLRFPEFQGEWKEHKLEDITAEIGDGIHATPIYDDNGTFYFVNGNNISEYGIIITATTQKVTEEEALRNNASALNSYSILLSINGTVGNVALYKNESIMLGKSACYINVSSNINRNYIFYYLMMPKCQFYFTSELTGTTIKNLSLKSIRKTKVLLPNANEQSKIARLFDAINERIVTQNKIIEDLKKLKSAISENLFKEVKGDVAMLSEICEISKGKQINGEFLSEKGKYYVMNGGTEPSGYYNNYNVEANTISISEGGNSCGYVQFNTSPFWSGGHCYTILEIADNVDNLYLYHFLKSKENDIMKLRIGSGLPNIQKKDLAMFKIKIPTVEQQKAISTFLSSLERKTEIEERTQNAMQKEKQYLLRQMFI
ncbi:restriction endonuclease subunit S [Segatella hominis]|uniref:restriction endonuclease subunit S n=1 Tax=Segatella hominis TaxID=2518605 RepID=UPI0021C7EA0C|nr:restriction endonuclease subunit S [Segatella hominis]